MNAPERMTERMTGRVLVVDDEALNRELLERFLRFDGHTVAHAGDGAAALVALRAGEFDLVLLDIMMPELDGYEVLRQIKADERLRHVPVLMISALSDLSSTIRCIELGAADTLPKPFDPVLLKARVDASLEKKRQHDQQARYLAQIQREKARADRLLNVVIPIGAAMAAERDFDRLLQTILSEAQALCSADAGALLLRRGDHLDYMMARFESLGVRLGSEAGTVFPAIPLTGGDGAPGGERPRLAPHALTRGVTLSLADIYQTSEYDLSDLRRFDTLVGYRTRSCLCVPLKGAAEGGGGVLLLLNAGDGGGGTTAFSAELQQMVEALSRLAAAALDAYRREASLRQRIEELSVAIDQMKKTQAVAEITETDYFRRLQERAADLRRRKK